MQRINPAIDDTGVLLTEDGKLRNTAGPSFIAFRNSIVKRSPTAKHYVYSPAGALDPQGVADVAAARALVFTTRNGHQAKWQFDFLRMIIPAARPDTSIIVVSSCAPYDVLGVENLDIPALGTFEFTAAALETAAAVLFDGLQAFGKSPVRL